MPRIVEYLQLVEAMRGLHLRSLYYNSGAFGYERDASTKSTGWICAEDGSLRPEARQLARLLPGPPEGTLASLLTRAVTELFDGAAWLMPKSHWAFELDFGSKPWMPAALQQIGLDDKLLAPRTTGDAIAFSPNEIEQFTAFSRQLIANLMGSDFAMASPGKSFVCTLHHHKQVWWTTTDPALLHGLEQLTSDFAV